MVFKNKACKVLSSMILIISLLTNLILITNLIIYIDSIRVYTNINKPNINNMVGFDGRPINVKTYKKILNYTKDPYISEILSASKYPYLLAAIAKVESDYRPQIQGDKGDAHGLYQVSRRNWGVSYDRVTDQTVKAERILEGLIRRHGYYRGVERWNGSGKQARLYAKKVFKVEREIRYGRQA